MLPGGARGWGWSAAPLTHTSPVPPGYPQKGVFLGREGAHGVTSKVWGGRARGFLWDVSLSNLATPQG